MSEHSFVTTESQPILFVHRSSGTDPESMAACMGQAFGTLMGFMGQHGMQSAGAPMTIYHGFGETEATFDVVIPISAEDAEQAAGDGDVKVTTTYSGRALKTVHVGPYRDLAQTYENVMSHMKQEGLEPVAPCWEVYRNDPATTPEEDLVTEIFFPVT